MPKYYVQSGEVRVVFHASDARHAAIRAFQWSCDQQAQRSASRQPGSPDEDAADRWLLEEEIVVSEQGFAGRDARRFETLQIVAAWQAEAFPWG